MAEGRIIGHLKFGEEAYVVREHKAHYHPPVYIREYRALSRDATINGKRVPFYKGEKGAYRVTFPFNGVWCYVDRNGNNGRANLQDLLMNNLERRFEFFSDSELDRETTSSPFKTIAHVSTNKL